MPLSTNRAPGDIQLPDAPTRKPKSIPSVPRDPSIERRRPQAPARPQTPLSWLTVAAYVVAALGVVQFWHPPTLPKGLPFADRFTDSEEHTFDASSTPDAFGTSGAVKVRFAMPGSTVEFPLAVDGNPEGIVYQWIRVGDSSLVDSARSLAGSQVVAPKDAGFYRLALVRGGERQIVKEPTVAVMVPFERKTGGVLNGYLIGTYLAERLGGDHERPEGFVEIRQSELDLPMTAHLRLRDFVTHDEQETWPRYAALNPRLLDKLELVVAEVGRWRGDTTRVGMSLDVHSGFRSPAHNREVRRAASDSRHQYGDAADVTIDADGDGRYTLGDSKLVAIAVEMVERQHPELTGGLGLYTSRRYHTPYVHIDTRGHRARWHG